MEAWLETEMGKVVEVRGSLTMGRALENDLVLASAKVSRRHALVYLHAQAHWIMDFGSRNGVFVNDRPLREPLPLRDNDKITVGGTHWIYRVVGRPRRAAEAPQLAGTEPEAPALSPSGRAVVVLDAEGRIQVISEGAAAWLAEYFSARPPLRGLPAAIKEWLKEMPAQPGGAPPATRAPLAVQKDGKQLVIHREAIQPGQTLLILTEEEPADILARLRASGLTAREAEVMQWIMEGKTNPDIATILAVSLGTINKHVEHILAKLLVENRASAIKVAREMLDRR